jgi:hypothetical protein
MTSSQTVPSDGVRARRARRVVIDCTTPHSLINRFIAVGGSAFIGSGGKMNYYNI